MRIGVSGANGNKSAARKYAYWISTTLLCLLYLASATMYVMKGDMVRQALGALGYPAYLVPFLITVKILGVAAILSRVNVALSDLAYAGMSYHLLLAFSAHINAGDGGFPPAIIGLCALIVSFLTQNAARTRSSPYALG
ncbi:DoxX family protein [Bradyrhizobium japonicum]|uniref:DoxX family protein n=1 Tax=Bradyrhizobium japonicum TaxID=375 RepID=UPI00067491E6|nr:DoxX family protein [Bradyrhizobium japonicum]